MKSFCICANKIAFALREIHGYHVTVSDVSFSAPSDNFICNSLSAALGIGMHTLAARCRANVNHRIPFFDARQLDNQLRTGVLYIKGAFRKTGKCPKIPRLFQNICITQQRMSANRHLSRKVLHPLQPRILLCFRKPLVQTNRDGLFLFIILQDLFRSVDRFFIVVLGLLFNYVVCRVSPFTFAFYFIVLLIACPETIFEPSANPGRHGIPRA